MEKTMNKIILSLIGSAVIAASIANPAMAAQHHNRQARMYSSARESNSLATRSAFGKTTPWRSSAIRPDDWRQGTNGS
jgi:Ni/Co efflux regulator RcnB